MKVNASQVLNSIKMKPPKTLSAVIFLCVLLGGYFAYSRMQYVSSKWYLLNTSAKITYNGRISQARLYQKSNSPLLLVVPEENLAYHIFPEDKRIFWASLNAIEISHDKAWNKNSDSNVPGIDLGYVNGVKTASIRPDTDSRFSISANRIEFNGLEAKTITIQFRQPEK